MEPQLVANRVTLTYVTGGVAVDALREVTLAVHPGEFLGVMGPSGSGKSSLLYVLAGIRTPTAGEVRFGGTVLSALPPDRRADIRRRLFGFVFQQHFLIGYLTALENVLVGAPNPSRVWRERAEELLAALGLGDKRHRFPAELSGGERQRVAVARALVHRPQVVFADEPTASLDHRRGLQLMELLAEARRRDGAALVVVTHDPTILRGADRVVHLWDGRLVRDGWDPGAPPPADGQA